MRSCAAGFGCCFFLRMLPAGLGAFIVAGLLYPELFATGAKNGYPRKEVGLLCLGFFSILTLALWGRFSISRGLRAITRSVSVDLRLLSARWPAKTDLPGKPSPLWMLEEPPALFAIAGIMRPRLLISRPGYGCAFRGTNSPRPLQHEQAHWVSRDNLKRLPVDARPGHATLS